MRAGRGCNFAKIWAAGIRVTVSGRVDNRPALYSIARVTTSTTHLAGIIAATATRSKPTANAQVAFQASAMSHDAVASTATLGPYRIEVDEPSVLGGEAKAPNPVEYYLASLLSCQIVTYRFWAERLGIAVDDITARAEGDLDVRGFFDSTTPSAPASRKCGWW